MFRFQINRKTPCELVTFRDKLVKFSEHYGPLISYFVNIEFVCVSEFLSNINERVLSVLQTGVVCINGSHTLGNGEIRNLWCANLS